MLTDGLAFAAGSDWNYDIAGSTLSTPSDGDIVVRFAATRAFTIPANMAGTEVEFGTDPSSSATLTLQKNGANSGAITINSSGTVTLPTQGAVSFAAGDVLQVVFTTVDSADDLSITIPTVAP